MQTLRKLNQLTEYVASVIKHKIECIRVQDHKPYDDVELKYHDANSGWTFISDSAWKNCTNSTIGGIYAYC